MNLLPMLKDVARRLKRDVMTVYYAARDSRTPWGVRLLAVAIAAYALSPIDLIPDFIPVIGYVDELLLLPFAIWLVLRLTPDAVIADSRVRAAEVADRPTSVAAAAVIVVVWVTVVTAFGFWLHRAMAP
jgi:uncharacterized membrane protein YkvA (DUF1232 family)